jgi:hypothetical protein
MALRRSVDPLHRFTCSVGNKPPFGKEDTKMYWYNPTTRISERVEAPSTDEQDIQMLAGTKDSAQFIKHYCQLRRSGFADRPSIGVGGTRVPLEATGVSDTSSLRDPLRYSGEKGLGNFVEPSFHPVGWRAASGRSRRSRTTEGRGALLRRPCGHYRQREGRGVAP